MVGATPTPAPTLIKAFAKPGVGVPRICNLWINKRKRLELILFANCGYGIRSEDRQLLALLLERLQRALHFGVFLVAVEIDEEDVLLFAGLGGKRLDPVEIQFVGFKDVECIHKRSGVVRDLEHEGGLVVASALAFLQADDGEAG